MPVIKKYVYRIIVKFAVRCESGESEKVVTSVACACMSSFKTPTPKEGLEKRIYQCMVF